MTPEAWILIDQDGRRYRIVREDGLLAVKNALTPYESNIDPFVESLVQLQGKEFGAKYRSLREKHNVDLEQLAAEAKEHSSNIRNIELGHRLPRPKTKRRLAELLLNALKK